MNYKHLIFKSLQFLVIMFLVSFVLDVGYSSIKQQSITEPFAAWVSSQFTIKRVVINLIIAAVFAYYTIKKEKDK